MDRNPYLTVEGLVLSKKNFSETSLICDVLTPVHGKISVLAKGIRKPANKSFGIMQTGAAVEMELHHKRDSEWYILKCANLIELYHSTNYETITYMQAGIELFRQLIIDGHESAEYYEILKHYLQYLSKIKRNAVAIFWRLLLRVMKMNGIEINWHKCLKCNTAVKEDCCYVSSLNGILCSQCFYKFPHEQVININAETVAVMNKIPVIGNHINNLDIKSDVSKLITRILLAHLNHNYDHHFHLKSLSFK